MSHNPTPRQRVVIIGGGFAGLQAAKGLDRKKYDVIIVDSNNYHSFPPLFYQVASSGLTPNSICFPFRYEMRKRPVKGMRFRMGQVKTIDLDRREVITDQMTLPYDRLIVAAGTTNNFFNMPQLVHRVYTLKSTSEAIRLRNDLLSRLERACVVKTSEERRRLLSFAVIGGGPTGVEVAGALGELKSYLLKRDYPAIPLDDMRITLIEGAPRLLGAMTMQSGAKARKYLGELGVDVITDVVMEKYDPDNMLHFNDGETLYSETVIWTAGITSHTFEWRIDGKRVERPAFVNERTGRIAVDEYNRVEGYEGLYAVGDIAVHTSEKYPRGLPQLAQPAIQGAKCLARNINTDAWDRPFVYKDKGTMATVGRARAVVELSHFNIYGWLAWVLWLIVHLMSLLGMRNKISVLTAWVWAYFTYSGSLRLLLGASRQPSDNGRDII